MSPQWRRPVDPECPEVKRYRSTLLDDPMSQYAPVDDILENWDRKHIQSCQRCQDYGAANIQTE